MGENEIRQRRSTSYRDRDISITFLEDSENGISTHEQSQYQNKREQIKRLDDNTEQLSKWKNEAERSKFDTWLNSFSNKLTDLTHWTVYKYHESVDKLQYNRVIDTSVVAYTNKTLWSRVIDNKWTILIGTTTIFLTLLYMFIVHPVVKISTITNVGAITTYYVPPLDDNDFIRYDTVSQLKENGVLCKHGGAQFAREGGYYLLEYSSSELRMVSIDDVIDKHEWLIQDKEVSDYMATTMHMNFTNVPCLCSVWLVEEGTKLGTKEKRMLHMVDPHIVAYSTEMNIVSEYNYLIKEKNQLAQKKIPRWLRVSYRSVDVGELVEETFRDMDVNTVDNCLMFLNEEPHGAMNSTSVDIVTTSL